MSNDVFDLGFEGMQTQINQLVSALDRMDESVNAGALQAAQESAEIIAREQKRLLSAANFAHPKADLQGLIKVQKSSGKKYYKLKIGYDSEAIKQHPELLVIEFGRPGKSARRMKPTDSLGRKKGDFPPQTPHIIAGFTLARDEAAEHFRDRMAEIAKQEWENSSAMY